MGEAKIEEKKEETKDQEKKELEKTEDKNGEAKTSPPNPVIMFVDLHCVGCAKKIERTILKYKGVEEVEINMVQNQVTVKGIVDPQALCSRIQKKTRRKAKIMSPVPPADQGDTTQPDVVVESQMNGTVPTVELLVNMHCDACAQRLQKKILEMRGVQRVEAELKSGKVTVSGTIEVEKLIDYIHRRTGKTAKAIISTPPKEEDKKEDHKPPEEKKEEKPDEEGMKKEDDTEQKKDENAPTVAQEQESGVDGDEKKKEGDAEGGNSNTTTAAAASSEEDMIKKTMNWSSFYMIERLPPPQIFSDENPNACCIS